MSNKPTNHDQQGSSIEAQTLQVEKDKLALQREVFENDKKSKWKLLSIFGAAVITAFGALLNSFVTSYQNHTTEDRKHRSNLMLDAVKTNDPAQSARNLLFLNECGFIELDTKTIESLKQKSGTTTIPLFTSSNNKKLSAPLSSPSEVQLFDAMKEYIDEFGDVNLNLEKPNDSEYMARYRRADAKLDYILVLSKSLGRKDVVDKFVNPRRDGIHQISMGPALSK